MLIEFEIDDELGEWLISKSKELDISVDDYIEYLIRQELARDK